jgi:hypothetical protein
MLIFVSVILAEDIILVECKARKTPTRKIATGWAVCVYVAGPLGLGKPGFFL